MEPSKVSTINKTTSLPLLLKKTTTNLTNINFQTAENPSLFGDSDDVRQRLKAPGRRLTESFIEVKKRRKMQDDDNGFISTSPLRKRCRTVPPVEYMHQCSADSLHSSQNKTRGNGYLNCFVICIFMTFVILSPIPTFIYMKFINVVCSNKVSLDFEDLKSELHYRVLGQHIAITEIMRSLDEYFKDELLSHQPLILSLHGGPGVGKTLTARIIEKHFISQGISVYWYLLTKKRLSEWIIPRLATCTLTVFIIDDINLTELVSVIQLQEFLEMFKHSFITLPTTTVFIITTSYGAAIINDITVQQFNQRKPRHDLTKDSFVDFTVEIQKHLNISDVKIIPYMPLEKEIIEVCAKNRLLSLEKLDSSHEMNKIQANIKYFPEENPVFSESGCKKLYA